MKIPSCWTSPSVHSSLNSSLCSPIPVRRTKHVFPSQTYILGDTSSIRPLRRRKRIVHIHHLLWISTLHSKATRIERVEETRQDRRRGRGRDREPASASRGDTTLAHWADRARARRAERLHPTPASSREPRNYGRVFLRSPACLVFHFCFSGSGRVVQSDNVTFPPYADLPAMFGPPIPAGEERLLGVLKVSPF